jgi:hypothetical protein
MEHRVEPLSRLPLRRLAALASIALVGLLIAGAGTAAAATRPIAPAPSPGHPGQTSAAAEPEEEVEWEWGEEEEEEVEWPFEEGGEIEVELEFEEEASLVPNRPGYAAGCALQNASARVVASDLEDMLHLSLRYASREPVRVEVHYGFKGRWRAVHLYPVTLRPARHGRVDYTEHPGFRRMSKLRAARALLVTIEMPGASHACPRYATKRLTSKRHGPTKTVWSEARRRPRARR